MHSRHEQRVSPARHVPVPLVVPEGAFVIGEDGLPEAEAPNPRRRVELSGYAMAIHPVTNREYLDYVQATGAARPATWRERGFERPDQPVVGVSWDEALAYCRWAGGRLPTEAEWEACARGQDLRPFPWGRDGPDERLAHYAQDWNQGRTARVGTHPEGAGPYGHHDLAGNVWEWCLDAWCKDERALLAADPNNPLVVANNPVRPLRGGCWRSIDSKLHVSYRNWFHRVARHVTIGFRLCVGVELDWRPLL